ncbi:MAG: class I SAM-dependent DNA methyltransferase, partial [Sandarakinorhabdus sp.]|nr:class I SAM-dependent DNA methyltransferase [Sandarakinorhabdus sp.]
MNLETFITKWQGLPGGAERANFPPFISEFCRALGLPEPDPAVAGTLTDYRFEAPVRPDAAFSAKSSGRIDLYKRRCFVLEAKQSRLNDGEKAPVEPPAPAPAPVIARNLFGEDIVVTPPLKPAAAAPRRYDRLMEDALAQAKGYALALPSDHGWPPFLIVCDVGRAFELHFDWAGNGKGYGFFPDQKSYRIELADLRKADVRALLIGIWTDPASVDPRRQAVRVTRDIALRLASVSKFLETDRRKQLLSHTDSQMSQGIEDTSMFLMRMLFCMFAEDVGLLPEKTFQNFLADSIGKSDQYWRAGLTDLWSRMNDANAANRYWSFGDTVVRYFNGNLFSNFRIFDLPREQKGELLQAATSRWNEVEPAIFGTLLEQALTPGERAKLGAHYTPRPYVERLVDATIMDLLRAEWDAVRLPKDPGKLSPPPAGGRSDSRSEPGEGPSLAAALAFHARLAALKILDPACGTGNFLYVAMEQLLRLESDVLVLIAQLGGAAKPMVGPNQFLGLELNPRAAVIAELVLWIGWLRFRLANDPASIGEPVLPPLHNINFGKHGGYDALLAGNTETGETANLATPAPADWPAADFIIGNPPFIGGKDLRAKLGSDYAEALWQAAPAIPKSADLVMQWWDRAAARLTAPGTRLRRFGFVTTNSITQSFSRRVIEARLLPPPPAGGRSRDGHSAGPGAGSSPAPLSLSLVLAIADHPWTRTGKDAAAVRIAMTVAAAGDHDGTLITITGESGLETDNPTLMETRATGRINADLTTGTDVTNVVPLKANEGICSPGVKLHGAGFIVTPAQAAALGLGTRAGLEAHIRPYRNGRDLLQRSRGVMVIDLFGLTEAEVRQRFPEVYQHLLVTVRDGRAAVVAKSATADAKAYLVTWWVFGKARSELRAALSGLPRYIATVETSKHRVFHFLDASILPDNMLVAIGSDDGFHHGVLSSSFHDHWSRLQGGTLEDRPRYS